jgi:hypothetical protein
MAAKRVYPFPEIGLGEEFFVTLKHREQNSERLRNNILSAARHCKPMQFTTSIERTGVRVRRVK